MIISLEKINGIIEKFMKITEPHNKTEFDKKTTGILIKALTHNSNLKVLI